MKGLHSNDGIARQLKVAKARQAFDESLDSGVAGTSEDMIKELRQMTDEEIRIKIAEFCGWTDIVPQRWTSPEGKIPKVEGVAWTSTSSQIPSYLTDLNAMHKAEKKLPDFDRYMVALHKEVEKCERDDWATAKMLHATARQRALAFIKTIESDA